MQHSGCVELHQKFRDFVGLPMGLLDFSDQGQVSTASKPLVAHLSSASDNLQLNNAKKARKYAIFRAFSMPEIAWFRWWNLRKFDFKLTHFDGFTMGLRPIFEPNGWENGFTEGHFGGEISPISLTDFRQKSGWNGMKNSVRFVWRVLTNSAKI